jgi:hypothetical protein
VDEVKRQEKTHACLKEEIHAFIPSFNEKFPFQCEILPKEIKDKAWV